MARNGDNKHATRSAQTRERFIEAAQRSGADAVAISALLTTTMKEMGVVVEALKQSGINNQAKIIVGGAPVTAEFAVSIGADGYAPDAGSAVEKLQELVN